jgi:hypothetical protein
MSITFSKIKKPDSKYFAPVPPVHQNMNGTASFAFACRLRKRYVVFVKPLDRFDALAKYGRRAFYAFDRNLGIGVFNRLIVAPYLVCPPVLGLLVRLRLLGLGVNIRVFKDGAGDVRLSTGFADISPGGILI